MMLSKKTKIILFIIGAILIQFIIYDNKKPLLLSDIILNDYVLELGDIKSIHLISQDLSPYTTDAFDKQLLTSDSIDNAFDIIGQIKVKSHLVRKSNIEISGIAKYININIYTEGLIYNITIADNILWLRFENYEKSYTIINPEILDYLFE